MSSAKQHDLAEKMQKLTLRYLENLKKSVLVFKKYILLLEMHRSDLGECADLKFQAHSLAGTGSTYGFTDISAAGRALDNYLAGDRFVNKECMKLIRTLLDACEEALASSVRSPAMATQEVDQSFQQDESALPLVLIVDDDENVRNMLMDLLSRDARRLAAANTTDAISLMKKHRPNLVLLDDKMSEGESGLHMLEELEAYPEIKDIPIIMITASTQSEQVMRGLMAGAVDYITKPFDPEAVIKKIQGHLERQNLSILIADDDEAVRAMLSHKFQMAGCKVICTADGATAWETMSQQPFALMVLDRMMPGYDGMTLMRMIKENSSLANIPAVFLTARHYGTDVLDGLNIGAADYIKKPFNPDEVVARCLRLIPAHAR